MLWKELLFFCLGDNMKIPLALEKGGSLSIGYNKVTLPKDSIIKDLPDTSSSGLVITLPDGTVYDKAINGNNGFPVLLPKGTTFNTRWNGRTHNIAYYPITGWLDMSSFDQSNVILSMKGGG